MKRKQRNNLKPASKLQKLGDEGVQEECESPFEMLLRNPGYHFIVEQICENLNSNDLAKCHRVSKRFHVYLNHNRQWWITQLRFIRETPKAFKDKGKVKKEDIIEDKFPEWQAVFNYFENKRQTSILKTFVSFMKTYHQDVQVDRSPIWDAISKGKTSAVKLLLESPINIDKRTILHYACKFDNLTIVKLLLKTDIDVNSMSKAGDTPLFYACSFGRLNVVKHLLTHPQINYKLVNIDGRNILHYAAMYPQVLGYILSKCNDLDINARDRNGKTPLHYACNHGSKGTVEVLLKHNADLSLTTNCGITPLHLATVNKNQTTFKFLLKKCPSDMINLRTNAGLTSLHFLCENNQVETLRYIFTLDNLPLAFNVIILNHGLTPLHMLGRTPLHMAANKGHIEVVNLFLENSKEKNIDICKEDFRGKSALDLAKSKGHQSIVQAIELWQSRIPISTKTSPVPRPGKKLPNIVYDFVLKKK